MSAKELKARQINRRFALGATYQVKSRFHGRGKVLFAWGNNPEDNDSPTYLASSGTSKVIHVFTKDHNDIKNLSIVDQIMPPGSSICTALAWDSKGEILCCAQENSSLLVFWYAKEKKYKTYDVGTRDVSLIEWCNGESSTIDNVGLTNIDEENVSSSVIAVGTGKGTVLLVNSVNLTHVKVDSKKRRRVEIGTWNGNDTQFIFCCQDRREIYVASIIDGSLLKKIKTKLPVISLLFSSVMPSLGGDRNNNESSDEEEDTHSRRNSHKNAQNMRNNRNSNISSKNRNNNRSKGGKNSNNMNKRKTASRSNDSNGKNHNNNVGNNNNKLRGRRTNSSKNNYNIISVNLNGEAIYFYDINNENSVEISFQARYGKILGHAWMSKHLLSVGFSGGYVVVLNIQYYNRELFCVELPAVRRIGNHNIYNVNYVINDNNNNNNNGMSANTTLANDNNTNTSSTNIALDDNNSISSIEDGNLHFQYFPNYKVASVYTKNHLTLIDLNRWEDSLADVMHLNFGGSDDHSIAISPSGSIISVCSLEGNVWHYATRFIFGKKQSNDIDLYALNKLLLDFMLRPIPLYSLILSGCVGVVILVSFIASVLDTSPTNVFKIMIGVYDMNL
jgi:hypothetical protein